jgi:hypothetical protein
MRDHPILGAVLFAIGAVLVGLAFYSSNAPPHLFNSFDGGYTSEAISSLVLGHIIVFNGVLLVALGSRKLDRARGRISASR